MEQTRLAAADLLLNRGMRFKIADAPFIWRLLRLNRITVKPLKGGTIATIDRLIVEHGLTDARKIEDVNQKLDVVYLIIAVAILNNEKRINKYAGRLARLLFWKVNTQTIFPIYEQVAKVNKISDFMIITKYFSHLGRMMMSPKNLGQMEKGS